MLRIVFWLLLIVLVVFGGLGGYAFYAAHSALPQLDGRLQVNGLAAAVTVTRDSHGVPTIDAATLEDLFFAQGYVTAQDRLWQMDMMRRCWHPANCRKFWARNSSNWTANRAFWACGRPPGNLSRWLHRETHAFFEAYARGVNAYIDHARNISPLNFGFWVMHLHDGRLEDSIVIANQMVKDLNYHYFFDALAREKILAKLGPELTADLYVNRSWHDRPPDRDARRPEPACK